MSSPVILLKNGAIRGKIAKDLNSGTFYSYQGIPYAKPPTGNLRFKAPEPAEPWSKEKDCTHEGNECYSPHMLFEHIVGSEDCLKLNVYTPASPGTASKKAVMVWIHGGGFRTGSSKTELYGPEYLVAEDVVLVTLNYRLGIFGFLCLEKPSLEINGNAGLKDMVLALQWVQENIEKFGGDRSNVTIFGESAGAAAVHYLMLSPLCKGLFHKVIAQSGCALNTFAQGRQDLRNELAEALKLKEKSDADILNKLLELSSEQLLEISNQITLVPLCGSPNAVSTRRPFGAVVENKHPKAFLTQNPWEVIKAGNYNKVPIIFRFNNLEGLCPLPFFKPEMPENFETVIPFHLNLETGSKESLKLAKAIQEFYYPDEQSKHDLHNYHLLISDICFIRDIISAAKLHASNKTENVLLYRMSIETELNVFKNVFKINNPGVSHGDDIGYLFKTDYAPKIAQNSELHNAIRTFTNLWSSFAKTGAPTHKSLPINWQPVAKNELNFLDINKTISCMQNPENERIQFWTNALKL